MTVEITKCEHILAVFGRRFPASAFTIADFEAILDIEFHWQR